MDYRSAVIGAIAGAGVCGAVWWLVERDSTFPATAVLPQPAETEVRSYPTQSDRRAEVPPPDVPVDHAGPEVIAGEPTQSADAVPALQGIQAEMSKWNVATAERLKEAKDLGWSYTMEQMLRQYLASQRNASQFDIALVDCRTTFCDVGAYGISEDAWPAWMQVTQDISKQPWSEFGSNGSSVNTLNERPLFVTTFWREQSLKRSPGDVSAAATNP